MAKFHLNDITNIDGMAIEPQKWDAVFDEMLSKGWAGRQGQRVGILKPLNHRGMIAGYFAQEGRKKVIQYDDNKEEIEPGPSYSFEHLYFMLFSDTAQILIQSRNFYDYVDLSLSVVRTNLLLHLTDLFRLAGIYVAGRSGIDIEDAGMSLSYEELYATFTSIKQISEIEITNLFGAVLPAKGDPRYRLFNPKEEWDDITWGAIADTLKLGLDSAKLVAIEDQNATLKAPIPKALAAVGTINKIKGSDDQGKIIIRQHTEDTEVEFEMPEGLGATTELLDIVLEDLKAKGRVETWEDKRKRRRPDGFNN